MNTPAARDPEHDFAQEQLPWLVNGTLVAADVRRIELHVATCAACRRDIEAERALARQLVAAPVVELSPQAGLAQVLQQIDAPGGAGGADADAVAARRVAATDQPWWLAAWRTRPLLAGALLLQAAALAVLAVTLVLLVTKPPEYHTLSSPAATGAQLQVVFDEALPAGELRGLLDAVGGRIVSGPSPAGVFLVALPPQQDAAAAVRTLAAAPGVRFAAVVPGS